MYPCNPVELIFIYLLIAWFCQNVIEGQFVIFVIQDQLEPKEDAYFTEVKKDACKNFHVLQTWN